MRSTLSIRGLLLQLHGVFLLPAPRAHHHIAARAVGVGERHAGIAQEQFAKLVRMRHAAGLDDGQAPVAFSVLHQIGEIDPGIHHGRNLQR